MSLLEKLEQRIWLSNQAGFEFLDNRLNVIAQQEKSYDEMIVNITSIEETFKNNRQHPFIGEGLLKQLTKNFNQVEEQLQKNKKYYSSKYQKDEILDSLSKLFDDKTGEEFDQKSLEEIQKSASERYSKKIPPGYKDNNKKEKEDSSTNTLRKYGDYVLWKQLMNISIKDNKDVILITDDRKEDWWHVFQGKTIGPRPELVKEFVDETGRQFYMYTSDKFLEFANKYLNQKLTEKTIQEVRELRETIEKIETDRESKIKVMNEIKVKEDLLLEERFYQTVFELEQLRELAKQYSNKASQQKLTKEEKEHVNEINDRIRRLKDRERAFRNTLAHIKL